MGHAVEGAKSLRRRRRNRYRVARVRGARSRFCAKTLVTAEAHRRRRRRYRGVTGREGATGSPMTRLLVDGGLRATDRRSSDGVQVGGGLGWL
ncbi:hypothetical protein NL676_016179 [Syzygium grande]|nr:hypothetical protein NL676_016179 [Syzygium grande]